MDLSAVEKIVNAVLYEGYILYPYRASAVKNRQRFNFGAIYPIAYSESQGGMEPASMQTQCILTGSAETTLDIRVRFLHLAAREVGKLGSSLPRLPLSEPDYQVVDSLEIGGKMFHTWQEAVEREVESSGIVVGDLLSNGPRLLMFEFPSVRNVEPLTADDGKIPAVLVRTQGQLAGVVEVEAEAIGENAFKLTVRIRNLATLVREELASRDVALMRSLVSAHTVMGVTGGAFVSSFDTPEQYKAAVAGCQNVGTWPVLVGNAGECNCMLSSPIILYDYPEIAPESAGDLFDGTEIDEILTLRIMSLTDDEKREMRSVDERARRILDRTESLSPEDMMRLHGTVRGMRRVQSVEGDGQ
ncbi:MAG TPA: hypothetical protein VI756_13020 [Blastocatellia bacterium]